MAAASITTATPHPYVTRQSGVCGGKPVITGTRIRVSQVAYAHVEMGWAPQEILQAHPHLTLAQIHDALSYYYDHEAEIQAELREDDEFVETMRDEAGDGPFAQRMRAVGKLP